MGLAARRREILEEAIDAWVTASALFKSVAAMIAPCSMNA
jgi:hypothetical protein